MTNASISSKVLVLMAMAEKYLPHDHKRERADACMACFKCSHGKLCFRLKVFERAGRKGEPFRYEKAGDDDEKHKVEEPDDD